jgi:hypothetical protein
MTNDQKRDTRQSLQFAALWTFGSLRALSDGGAHAVTYYQTAGGQGILTEQGEPFPVYTFLERILSFRNKQMTILKNSHPLLADAMLFDGETTAILWMANYTQSSQKIRFEDREFSLAAGEIRSERLNRSKQF